MVEVFISTERFHFIYSSWLILCSSSLLFDLWSKICSHIRLFCFNVVRLSDQMFCYQASQTRHNDLQRCWYTWSLNAHCVFWSLFSFQEPQVTLLIVQTTNVFWSSTYQISITYLYIYYSSVVLFYVELLFYNKRNWNLSLFSLFGWFVMNLPWNVQKLLMSHWSSELLQIGPNVQFKLRLISFPSLVSKSLSFCVFFC